MKVGRKAIKKKARRKKNKIRFYRDVSCELKDRISMIFFKAPIKCGMSFSLALSYNVVSAISIFIRLDLFN